MHTENKFHEKQRTTLHPQIHKESNNIERRSNDLI